MAEKAKNEVKKAESESTVELKQEAKPEKALAKKKAVTQKKPEKKETKEEKKDSKDNKKVIFTIGKRKIAVARCTIKPGVGRVLIDAIPAELMENEVVRLMVTEPFLVIGNDKWKAYDFNVSLTGGGVMGQAEAARQAIARGLVELFGNDVRARFLDYNRSFLAYDPRRTEPHKPPRSSQGPRRYKQRSKR